MDPSDISILLATRNAAAHLPGALDSIRDTAPGSPVLIRDGASTDGTVELLRKRDAEIARWESAADQGVYDAFNHALDWVETPLVFFMGSDDRLRPEWADAVAAISDAESIWYGDVWMPRRGEIWRGETRTEDLARTNLCQQAVFYPANLLKQHPFHLEYPIQADWEFNMWAATRSGREWKRLPFTVATFDDRGGLSSTTYDSAFNRAYPALVRDYFGTAAWLRHGLPAALAHHTRGLRGKA